MIMIKEVLSREVSLFNKWKGPMYILISISSFILSYILLLSARGHFIVLLFILSIASYIIGTTSAVTRKGLLPILPQSITNILTQYTPLELSELAWKPSDFGDVLYILLFPLPLDTRVTILKRLTPSWQRILTTRGLVNLCSTNMKIALKGLDYSDTIESESKYGLLGVHDNDDNDMNNVMILPKTMTSSSLSSSSSRKRIDMPNIMILDDKTNEFYKTDTKSFLSGVKDVCSDSLHSIQDHVVLSSNKIKNHTSSFWHDLPTDMSELFKSHLPKKFLKQWGNQMFPGITSFLYGSNLSTMYLTTGVSLATMIVHLMHSKNARRLTKRWVNFILEWGLYFSTVYSIVTLLQESTYTVKPIDKKLKMKYKNNIIIYNILKLMRYKKLIASSSVVLLWFVWLSRSTNAKVDYLAKLRRSLFSSKTAASSAAITTAQTAKKTLSVYETDVTLFQPNNIEDIEKRTLFMT